MLACADKRPNRGERSLFVETPSPGPAYWPNGVLELAGATALAGFAPGAVVGSAKGTVLLPVVPAGGVAAAGAACGARWSELSIRVECRLAAITASRMLSAMNAVARIAVARVRKSAAPRADISPDGLPPTPSPPPSERYALWHGAAPLPAPAPVGTGGRR